MTPEERARLLREVTPEEWLRGIPTEELRNRLTPEQRLEGLSLSEIQAYLQKLEAESAKPKRKKPKRS